MVKQWRIARISFQNLFFLMLFQTRRLNIFWYFRCTLHECPWTLSRRYQWQSSQIYGACRKCNGFQPYAVRLDAEYSTAIFDGFRLWLRNIWPDVVAKTFATYQIAYFYLTALQSLAISHVSLHPRTLVHSTPHGSWIYHWLRIYMCHRGTQNRFSPVFLQYCK